VAYDGLDRFFPADRIIKTGNPVRADLLNVGISQAEAKKELGFDPEKPLVLVVGGSLGARTINESIAPALDRFVKASVMWQTGKLYADECVPMAAGHNGIEAMPFISRMDLAYRAADIVVSRAGAGTISELQLLGKPSVLVPSPNVAEDHQRKNAQALVDRNAAVMVPDSEARTSLADTVIGLLDDHSRRQTLGQNVAAMALPDSDEKIVDRIYELIRR
jgi:UDP-N-acetylglucosamine--N-acetylmuramyl-(pentapeptide) pyrophosphoryl-undecaprenol N-acetylglucosamine transferase